MATTAKTSLWFLFWILNGCFFYLKTKQIVVLMCPDTEPAMKLITMITSVGMKGGYHSLKNCCLTIKCMATKTPNNLCEKLRQPGWPFDLLYSAASLLNSCTLSILHGTKATSYINTASMTTGSRRLSHQSRLLPSAHRLACLFQLWHSLPVIWLSFTSGLCAVVNKFFFQISNVKHIVFS